MRPTATRAVIAGAIRRILGVEVPPTKAAAQAFRRTWSEQRGRLWPSAGTIEHHQAPPKLRFGEPWSPLASLDELARASNPARAREQLALEVAVASGGALRLDVRGWVARQLGEIASAREALGSPGAAWRPGAWPHGRLK